MEWHVELIICVHTNNIGSTIIIHKTKTFKKYNFFKHPIFASSVWLSPPTCVHICVHVLHTVVHQCTTIEETHAQPCAPVTHTGAHSCAQMRSFQRNNCAFMHSCTLNRHASNARLLSTFRWPHARMYLFYLCTQVRESSDRPCTRGTTLTKSPSTAIRTTLPRT